MITIQIPSCVSTNAPFSWSENGTFTFCNICCLFWLRILGVGVGNNFIECVEEIGTVSSQEQAVMFEVASFVCVLRHIRHCARINCHFTQNKNEHQTQ